ncbi:putative u1biquitin-specific peptidase protein [Botrytis fragariae]|uniref:Putative u1biquitin-specific peptidase protein n=1 Tax=Botrytis fragariae TaxID=1964551 RepID=A0A8H6B218_9HELO|nr:putative u1biquitin-specific peptidase protein [Botrytis fragariae]KAF5877627.1 putative u1biquitin-specific peptidase protein [Botrytis fragariae]
MGMIPGVNHFATATTTTIWQNHDTRMGFKELRRASPCSSLRQLYIESQRGNCGDRYTPTLRRVKSFYNPPKDFALVFAMSFLNHKDSMVEVKIDTSNFVITVEVPLRIHNPYHVSFLTQKHRILRDLDLAEDGPFTTMGGNAASTLAENKMQYRSNSGKMMDDIAGEDRLDEGVSEKRCGRSGCPNRFKKDGFSCKECQSKMYCSKVCAERHWPEHKLTCEHLNYVLSIDMYLQRHHDNRPGRIMSCPARATFEDFYQALSLSVPCFQPIYRFDIFDRSQMNGPINHYPRPEKIITGPNLNSNISDRHHDLLPLLEDSRRISLIDILCERPYEQSQKIIHYTCRDPRSQKYWQYMILFMERAPISPFLIIWSGASRCIEDYGKGQNCVTLRLAYEASEPTEEQRKLLSWYESIEDSKASREGTNQALSRIRTSMRPSNIHSSYNEAESFP